MPRKFKEARQINKLKVIEAAAKLGVSQPTLSAWEGERIICPHEPFTGSHVGPGMLALFFLGSHR